MSNPADLAEQLAEDGVAFNGLAEDPALQEQLMGALDGRAGFVVTTPEVGNHRDLAQDILRETDAVETVIVRSPGSAAAVSNEYTRAAIEGAQIHLFTEPDHTLAASQFLNGLEGFDPAWTVLVAGLVTLVAVTVGWTFQEVKCQNLTQ